MNNRDAARSVTAMAALLAHEVKNPLSGIRGAAQLLENGLPEEDRQLVRLIIDETDRIVALVDRMEVFSDNRPLQREPVNIHRVLEHVRMVAENGFAKHVRFVETYDPSLPPVLGNRDQLIQVLLNLVKNAAEAVPNPGGEIILSTAYQHGLRLRVPGGTVTDLPLVISVRDNGADGIPDDLKGNLFDPFVSTKPKGSGLGLPLAAKIINDHGGIIEFDSQPGRTVFSIILPMAKVDPTSGRAW
jgi:two-component system nitrogen regulation sensor histidine kinase GlnL